MNGPPATFANGRAQRLVRREVKWLQKAVIYHVFIDRFCRGGQLPRQNCEPADDQPVFCGGNLQGVAEKLDYLSNLGITAIWLSPFNKTAAYHGYHVTDYFQVDERFGGRAGLQSLVKGAQRRGIRLIMDFVPNHVHETHPWFQSARKGRSSPYRRWFHWGSSGDYLKFLDVRELPKLNLDFPEARQELIRAARFWMDQGIDGFRLDHALGLSLGFLREFRRQLKQHREDVAVFGEVYFCGIQRPFLASLHLPDKRFYFLAQQLGFDVLDATMKEYAGVFDGLLDFGFQKLLKTHLAASRRKVPDAAIQEMLDRHYSGFPENCCLLSFLDNHDLNRFLFEAHGDRTRLKRALAIQFGQKSPPILYYGTEAGMSQSGPIRGDHGDLQARRMLPWEQSEGALFKTCQQLIAKWKKLHGGA
jgi:glycosidase